ncbi:hypothetical protein M1293_00495 [Candidatus Parvarchaeota archaeon]|nr:hypothetical protein [Candidatus Parvarchaeota archaeon]
MINGRLGSIEGSVLLYIILIVVGVLILVVILEIFTPYKITDLFKPIFSTNVNVGNLI